MSLINAEMNYNDVDSFYNSDLDFTFLGSPTPLKNNYFVSSDYLEAEIQRDLNLSNAIPAAPQSQDDLIPLSNFHSSTSEGINELDPSIFDTLSDEEQISSKNANLSEQLSEFIKNNFVLNEPPSPPPPPKIEIEAIKQSCQGHGKGKGKEAAFQRLNDQAKIAKRKDERPHAKKLNQYISQISSYDDAPPNSTASQKDLHDQLFRQGPGRPPKSTREYDEEMQNAPPEKKAKVIMKKAAKQYRDKKNYEKKVTQETCEELENEQRRLEAISNRYEWQIKEIRNLIRSKF